MGSMQTKKNLSAPSLDSYKHRRTGFPTVKDTTQVDESYHQLERSIVNLPAEFAKLMHN